MSAPSVPSGQMESLNFIGLGFSIWPRFLVTITEIDFRLHSTVHDSYNCLKRRSMGPMTPWPTRRQGYLYCGSGPTKVLWSYPGHGSHFYPSLSGLRSADHQTDAMSCTLQTPRNSAVTNSKIRLNTICMSVNQFWEISRILNTKHI